MLSKRRLRVLMICFISATATIVLLKTEVSKEIIPAKMTSQMSTKSRHCIGTNFDSVFCERNEERKKLLFKECRHIGERNHSMVLLDNIIHVNSLSYLMCTIPKVACTNWKRVFMMLEHNISYKRAVKTGPHDYYPGISSILELTEKYLNFTKAMFVREPLERLLSAYRSKVRGATVIYSQLRQMYEMFRKNPTGDIKKKNYITFNEFCQYILDKDKSDANKHWQEYYRVCSPCEIKYDFIGKFENLEEEGSAVLKMLLPDKNVTFPARKDSGYKHTTSGSFDIMVLFYKTLPPGTIRRLWKYYEVDYRLFGYPYPIRLEREAEMAYTNITMKNT